MTDEEIKKAALDLLNNNRKIGYSGWAKKEYNFSCPSPKHYPYQWFWDSCFHVITLSHLAPELAKDELQSLVSSQQQDGFIPHVIFWRSRLFRRGQKLWNYLQTPSWTFKPKITGMIQPPVLAMALEELYKNTNDITLLKRFLPKVEAYYLWLENNRDPDEDNLIAIISPYESGLDYSPCFDETVNFKNGNLYKLYLRYRKIDIKNKVNKFVSKKILEKDYFNVEDVLVNSIWAEALAAMARLFELVGEKRKSEHASHKAKLVAKAIIEKCFDEKDGLFYNLSSKKEKMLKTKTIESLFPIILDDIDKKLVDNLVNNHLLNEKEYWLPYPVPSVPADEPTFNPNENRYIWRGPTWMNLNWFIVKGLKKHGYSDIANHIIDKSKEMIEKSGFREYFNPYTAEGGGAYSFGWSTLIVDMLR